MADFFFMMYITLTRKVMNKANTIKSTSSTYQPKTEFDSQIINSLEYYEDLEPEDLEPDFDWDRASMEDMGLIKWDKKEKRWIVP